MIRAFEQHLGCNSNEWTMDKLLYCKNVCRHKANFRKTNMRIACSGFLIYAELRFKNRIKVRNWSEENKDNYG